MKAKRVLIAGCTDTKGGLETYIMGLYRNIDRSRLQFDFLQLQKDEIAYAEEIRKMGGNIFKLPMIRDDFSGHYKSLKRIFSQCDYAGVYFQFNRKPVSLDTFQYARKAGVPHRVIHSHNSTESKMSRLHVLREKIAETSMDRYVTDYFACSEQAGRWMFGDRDFTVIKNSIDTDIFCFHQEKRDKLRENMNLTGKIVLGTVGRLEDAKNPFFLIDIFKEIHKKNPDTVFLHIGTGSYENDMAAKLKEYGLEESYLLLGQKKEIADYMNVMDMFLLPSKHEGFPFVLVEAQATGLKCLIADNITDTCDLTGNVEFLPIDRGTAVWEKAISDNFRYERTDQKEAIIRQGYDIHVAAQQIQDFFLS